VNDLTGFVLAGGKSSRMGSDKAFLTLGPESLLDRALRLLASVTQDVRIVGDKIKFATYAPTVIEDVYPQRGPLGGIHAALSRSPSELNLILATDMPLIKPEFLVYLTAQARNTATVVTVPNAGGGFQPLCAVYCRQFAELAEESLRGGNNKIDVLFAKTTVQVITEEQLSARGFSAAMFRNLNTKEDLEWARGVRDPESGPRHEL
jgi:molybdenum cofactor guanylyltransferase